ncbi:MAG TPA: serine hydrolase domain-containing protein [Acidobacteriota bacterium]|nr:serine hydrolase domain-containing protein [Acidobacteriota bacterium]
MKNTRRIVFGLLLAAAVGLAAENLDELGALLRNRTDEARKAVGIVAGTVDATGERFVAAGATAPGAMNPPDADTVFEIGSITKVFTSLVLADMVERGEVRLDDPVAKFLPPTVRMPRRDGGEITLLDLANHVSGLPRLPDNLNPADLGNPYADYGPDRLYEFLSRYTLPRPIGERYEYSNLGVGLLGQALALKAGLSYEALIRRRVLEPLGMTDTAITLTGSMKERLAVGTNPMLHPAKYWDLNVLAGAGALRSTARDMLKFLAAAMGLRETPLRRAFDLMAEKSRPTRTPDLEVALGWHIWKKYGTEIVWHNGGTGGFRSFAGFVPAKRTGVVVLCDTSFGVDDIGLHALEPQWAAPLLPPALGGPAEAAKPQGQSAPPVSPADLAIWTEFVSAMRQGGPGPDKVRPYYENLRGPILGWLKEMREKAVWAEWARTPEVHRVGEHIHFLMPLTFDGQTATYCLTFLVENGRWYFRHIEAINIRLDRTGPLPTSAFPDVDEATKARIREETRWSREVRVFNELAALKGKAAAFDFLKDGEGYFLAAKTWVPFVEPRRALVLYACWEQANLTGNEVTLEKLDDRAAVVRMSPYYFRLYHESAHLPQQIPFADYQRIFETIWKDRARAAGWTLEIEYGDKDYPASSCVLRFK